MADVVVKKVLKIFKNNWNSQVILYGPPGTSKTYSSTIIAAALLSGFDVNSYEGDDINEAIKEHLKGIIGVDTLGVDELAQKYLKERGKDKDGKDRYKLVQFHPSYSYEDFVRGIQVKPAENGVTYEVEAKIIEKFAEGCSKDKPKVLVIDEINRAPLGSVLGELIYGLEYRGEAISTSYDLKEKDDNGNIVIENGKEKSKELAIPKGLYIIGTMNTADRSIGSMDYAVRRRFAFVQVPSNPECIAKTWGGEDTEAGKLALDLYNALIIGKDEKNKGIFDQDLMQGTDVDVEDIKIGHTYFLGKEGQGIEFLKYRLEYQIYPIYLEYMKDGLIKLDEGKERFRKIIKNITVDEEPVFKEFLASL